MRRLILGDVLAASRALATLAPPQRGQAVAQWLTQAHAAHKYMKRFARPHPKWGIGTLEGRLGDCPRAPLDLGDPNLLAALEMVVNSIGQRRSQSLALPRRRPMC